MQHFLLVKAMHHLDSSDGLSLTTVKVQEEKKEEESKSRENVTSHKDYIHIASQFEINKSEFLAAAKKNAENYKTQETTNDDTSYWDEEVKDMIENVKKFHKALLEGEQIEDAFRFRVKESESRKMMTNKDDLKLLMEEIEKMDEILKLKINEEKKAKISRIQAEKESRNILTGLPCSKASTGIKFNLEEFMRLLNEVEKTEYGAEMNQSETGERGEREGKEKEKKEKTYLQQKTNNLKFVERNIQLAKCGRGTLSLTDEEKFRIEGLLKDIEYPNAIREKNSNESGASSTKHNSINDKEVYGITDEAKSILSQIDNQLEMLTEVRSKEYQAQISWIKKNIGENKIFEKNEKEKKKKQKKERIQLKKIDDLLNYISSTSNEEITPLSEEEMKNLVRESKEILFKENLPTLEGVQCPHEVITDLVTNAKLLMPKFKYRFEES